MASKSLAAHHEKHAPHGGVIRFHILMRLAYENLFFKKLRTTLTALGVMIGIGAVVFLLSFGYGLQNLVSKQVVGSSSVQTIDVNSPKAEVLKLNPDAFNHFQGYAGVSETGKSYNTAGRVKYQSSRTETVVYGANAPFIELSDLKYNSGEGLGKQLTDGVLINSALAKAVGLTNFNKAVGQRISLGFDTVTSATAAKKTVTKDFTIKGVFESEAQGEVFIDSSNFELAGMTNATQGKVVVKERSRIPGVRKLIEGQGFTTASPLDTIDQINQVFALLHLVLLGFGGIGVIIAVLGMFNTLTISLLERTREIGLMISLGARKQDVKRLFIVEALLLSVLGGLSGILGAGLLGFICDIFLNIFAHSNGVKGHISAFSFSFTLVLVTLCLSAVVGLVVVYFPARRASQISPIEALHNE